MGIFLNQSNNVATILNGNSGGTISNSATSIKVASSTNFPATPFAVIIEAEIVYVTAVAGTTWTVTRGQESSTAVSHNDGAIVRQILTLAAWNAVVQLQTGTPTTQTGTVKLSNSGGADPALTLVQTTGDGADATVTTGVGFSGTATGNGGAGVLGTANGTGAIGLAALSLLDGYALSVVASHNNVPTAFFKATGGQTQDLITFYNSGFTRLGGISPLGAGDFSKVQVGSKDVLNADYSINGYISPNAVINGNFDVWQRNTSFTLAAGAAYCADQWLTSVTTTSLPAITVSRQAFIASSGEPSLTSTYYLRWAQTSAGTSTQLILDYRIEDVHTFAGKQVTLSFWARATSSITLDAGVFQHYSVGNNSTITLTSFSLTTTWTKFSLTVTLPDLSSQTLDAGSYVGVRFTPHTLNQTQTFELAQVQLEQGPIATPFRFEKLEDTLRRCYRYYQKSFPYATVPAAATRDGSIEWPLFKAGAVVTQSPFIMLPVPMRVKPIVTLFNPVTAASAQVHNYSTVGDWTSSAANVNNFNEKGFIIAGTGNTSSVVGDVCGVQFVADATL